MTSSLPEKQIQLLGLLILLVTAWFSAGFHHFDEHFQILEFANWKAGNTQTDQLPWEFAEQMRPSLQPTIAYLAIQSAKLFGVESPFAISFVLRLLSALLAWVTMCKIYQTFKTEIAPEHRKWFLIFSFLLWMNFYNGVRFSSENWSGMFTVLGICYFISSNSNLKSAFTSGLLLGFAFLFRYQVGFMIAGFGLWLLIVNRESFLSLAVMASAVLLIIGFGILLDSWFYENTAYSAYNYFFQNIVEDKVSGFGVEPWWYYFYELFLKLIPPLSLLVLIGLFLNIKKDLKHPILWTLIPFLAIHNLIGHKEIRFLLPLLYFAPFFLIKGLWSHKGNRLQTVLIRVSFFINCGMILVTVLSPADKNQGLYRAIYNEQSTTLVAEKNPYQRLTLETQFYTAPSLDITITNEVESWIDKSEQGTLFLCRIPLNESSQLKLIYATYPRWILDASNINNWQEKTTIWYLYRSES